MLERLLEAALYLNLIQNWPKAVVQKRALKSEETVISKISQFILIDTALSYVCAKFGEFLSLRLITNRLLSFLKGFGRRVQWERKIKKLSRKSRRQQNERHARKQHDKQCRELFVIKINIYSWSKFLIKL